MGVFVGEDGIAGDKEKAMWDKTLKRGKEFSPVEQPRLTGWGQAPAEPGWGLPGARCGLARRP